jgi:hypothetical protein
MYMEFLVTEPGIGFQDQGTKGVTYTFQIKNRLHADYLLPRRNNDVLGLSKWHKKTIKLLNPHGIARNIFLVIGNFDVSRGNRSICH